MKIQNVLSGLGLIAALSPAVARADAWDDFRTEARARGYGVMEVPLKADGTPKYKLWNVAEAVRGDDFNLADGYDSASKVTLCDSLTVRNEVVGINNRVADVSAEIADVVGLTGYAAALRSDTQLVHEINNCYTVKVDVGRDGVRGDDLRFYAGGTTRGSVLVALKPEDMPSPVCPPVNPVEPVVPAEPVVPVVPAVIILPDDGAPSLEFLPRGQNQWDLGYRRLGVIGGVYGRNFIVEHLSDEKVNTIDGEHGLYLAPRVTLPIVGSDKWNLFVDYDGKFTKIRGDITGAEQDHLIAGGLQYFGENFGLGAELGGILYGRTTDAVDGDVSTTTQQVGNGLGARVLFRAPGAVLGYNFDRVPLDVIVDGNLEGYGSFSANASADVSQHEIYGGPLFGNDKLEVLPYASFRATNVDVEGNGNVPDQSNSQSRFGFGVDGRLNLSDHLTLNPFVNYRLFEDVNTNVNAMDIETGHKTYDVGVGVTYRP